MNKWYCLIIGGAAGTVCRYLLAGWVFHRTGASAFPYGTLAVNLLGCFLVSFLTVILEVKLMLGPAVRLLFMVGFCGAFTTFSAMMLEFYNLMRGGHTWLAFAYAMISFVLGFWFFRAGLWVGDRF